MFLLKDNFFLTQLNHIEVYVEKDSAIKSWVISSGEGLIFVGTTHHQVNRGVRQAFFNLLDKITDMHEEYYSYQQLLPSPLIPKT